MSFLSDLLNPSLLIFLGITLLIIALLIVYFESKMREQNHKISSMLSLVSSLAEETNMIKLHLNHMNISNINGGMNFYQPQNIPLTNNSQENKYLEQTLIPVSDDDYDDSEDGEDADDEDEDDEDEDDEDEDDEDEDDEEDEEDEDSVDCTNNFITIKEVNINDNDIKVLNLDNTEFYNKNGEDDVSEEDNGDLEDIDFNQLSDNESDEEVDIQKQQRENIEVVTDNLKSIHISSNLEEQSDEKNKNIEVIDYKKLSLNKLKSIVLEKGISSDPSKLKKHDLLKLLNVE